MLALTKKEREALILLFKDFRANHNASSLGKRLEISRIGAMKILKKLEKHGLIKSEKIGNSLIFKLDLNEDYTIKLMSFLLSDEANNFKRWQDEFKKLFKPGRIVIFFGSASRNYLKANDIDILVVIDKKDYKEIAELIEERQQFLPKKIQSIIMTRGDLESNIRNNLGVSLEIVKTGIVLYGQNDYVEVIKNVTSV